jgi:predicted nucleic acid-binding protein
VIVLDASAIIDLLLGVGRAARVEARIRDDPSMHAPGLLDVEVAQVLRRLTASGAVSEDRGRRALATLADFSIRRYPHDPLLTRIWRLRAQLTAYDAAYVALAEVLDAPLLTRDARLGRATGHRAKVEVL